MADLEPAADACLERTRSAVLNVLTVAGIGIAVTGFILRGRTRGAWGQGAGRLGSFLMMALFAIVVASYVVRRMIGSRAALADPSRRAKRFHRAHVASALVAAVAVPVGFVHGWFVRPRLDAVAPYWIAAVGLGLLAFPRAEELRGFDQPLTDPSEFAG
jgi:hypothetical protein